MRLLGLSTVKLQWSTKMKIPKYNQLPEMLRYVLDMWKYTFFGLLAFAPVIIGTILLIRYFKGN